MKSLKSNGLLSDGEWMGVDTEIKYPGVDTCITVTCLVGRTLAGCHLFHYWRPGNNQEHHDKCLSDFANAAVKHGPIKAVYIIGNIGHWAGHLAEVTKQLKEKLGYLGPIGGSEPETCTGEIAAKLTGPVSIAFTKDGSDEKLQLKILDL
jgi:hypothetical protein